jgi:predicted nucleotidyltransferase
VTAPRNAAPFAADLAEHPVPEYAALRRNWLAVLSADRRVRSVTVSGSVARGTADRFSDLDLAVTVADHELAGFARDAEQLARQVAPVFLFRVKPAGGTTVCSVLTEQLHRVDLLVSSELGQLDTPSEPADESDSRRMALHRDVLEFLRVLALYPTVAERGEWLAAVDGACLLRTILVRVMLADSSLPPAGTRRLNARLSVRDRRRLEQLPPLSADPASVADFTAAVATSFFALAPATCRRLGTEWPARFAAAAATAVRAYLGDLGKANEEMR